MSLWFWALVAFLAGGCLGLLVVAMIRADRDADAAYFDPDGEG